MLIAPWITQCISIVARLGIADLLADGARSTQDLAARTETHEPSLHRVLRMLAEAGLFIESPPRHFALTAQGHQLRTETEGSLRAWAIFCGEPFHLQVWAEALHSVRTGEPAFNHLLGQSFFDYLGQHPAEGQNFDLAMTNLTRPATRALVSAYDWSGLRSIVDVGGGNGTLVSAVLEAQPHLTGVLFDEAVVMARAGGQPRLQGLVSAGRCTLETGDFFDAVPAGGDAYLLKYIIHDWSDEQALRILTNCRRAMHADSRLLLIEHVLVPGSGPHFGTLLDVEMLVLLTGLERTEAGFRTLLAEAGFTLTRVIPTPVAAAVPAPLWIIEARPSA